MPILDKINLRKVMNTNLQILITLAMLPLIALVLVIRLVKNGGLK